MLLFIAVSADLVHTLLPRALGRSRSRCGVGGKCAAKFDRRGHGGEGGVEIFDADLFAEADKMVLLVGIDFLGGHRGIDSSGDLSEFEVVVFLAHLLYLIFR